MGNMKWKPGQLLGQRRRGIRIPVKGWDMERDKREGLGYGDSKQREGLVLEQIVEVLKLKTEQDLLGKQTIKSVFEEDPEETKQINYKSEITVQIFEYEVIGLVDTGSDITCISEEFWRELSSNQTRKIPLMPIKTLHIRTAVGHKSAEIRNMAILPLNLGTITLDTGCLIVPGLVNHLILGFDWMNQKGVTIKLDRSEKGLIIPLEGIRHLIRFREPEVIDNSKKTGEIRMEIDKTLDEKLQELETGTEIGFDGREKLMVLLSKYKDLFSSKLGRANCYQHHIEMAPHSPIVKRSYPVPYAYRERVEEKLRELESQEIISRSATPYCSPLTFTLKRDGSIRVLLDAREINKYMVSETEKPPLQIDVLNSFHGANYISIVDLNNAYFQIPISSPSRKYTGFTFNGKSYVYNVLPQGLKTSVGSFSRAMDIILGHEVRDYCVNYLDDLAIITTGTFNQHLEHLDTVLGKIQEAGLTCNVSKCEFLCKEVKMLGYIISTSGLRTDPEKVKAIQEFPAPKKLKQIRAFLGLCNFYRRFIPDYSKHIRILCELLKKETVWRWGEIEQKAFDGIKKLFVDTIELQHPDLSKPFHLQTDSSGIGIAGVLYQIDENGDEKVIGFHSKPLRGAQLNWTVTEQEFYAVINCLEKFETYLRGTKLIIKTDHKALIFVKTWKLYNARVTRWINYLENFKYEVEHVKGKENIVADILSRYPPESDLLQEDKIKLPEILYMEVKENKELINNLKNIVELQKQDEEIKEILNLRAGLGSKTLRLERVNERCTLEKDILYFRPETSEKPVIYLPKILTEDIIKQVHIEMGHQGAYKVIKYIRDRFYWYGLTRQVKQILKKCHDCQLTKHEGVNYVGPCQSIISKEIGELVMVDLYGPLPTGAFGMNYILVLQDTFSKFVKFYELRQATARSVIGRVKKFFEIIKPKAIMSDNGSQFASKTWKEFMEQKEVKVIYTTVRNPRPNTVERVNRELGRLFRTYCGTRHKSWVAALPKLEELYNNTLHGSTGFTPCEIMYGESTKLSFDKYLWNEKTPNDVKQIRDKVQENLQKIGEKRRTMFNQRYRLIQYQIGDLVKIRKLNKSNAKQKITKKFELLYEGPYVISRNPYQNVYILTDPASNKIRGKFNTIHLSKYYK